MKSAHEQSQIRLVETVQRKRVITSMSAYRISDNKGCSVELRLCNHHVQYLQSQFRVEVVEQHCAPTACQYRSDMFSEGLVHVI